jgi:alanine racemase
MNNRKYKSWIEISRSSLLTNINLFRNVINNDSKLYLVVKANAYGHGLNEIIGLTKELIDGYCVDSFEEAIFINNICPEMPILVLGFVVPSSLSELIKRGISFVIYDINIAIYISKLKLDKKAKIHMKIETGLNRQGIRSDELVSVAKYMQTNHVYFEIEGAYTHFADIEDTLDSSYALNQLINFNSCLEKLRKINCKPKMVHCAATAGILLFPDTHMNMIRLGIGQYGLLPSRETKIALSLSKKEFKLLPVLQFKSIVVQLKKVKIGESVGYGRSWYSSRNSIIAIVPVGYSDGYDRKLSNNSRVLVNGMYAPVIGRVAMNMIHIDVTDINNIKVEDEVILIGKQGKNSITVEEIANRIGTINYEVVARLSRHLPRIVVD